MTSIESLVDPRIIRRYDVPVSYIEWLMSKLPRDDAEEVVSDIALIILTRTDAWEPILAESTSAAVRVAIGTMAYRQLIGRVRRNKSLERWQPSGDSMDLDVQAEDDKGFDHVEGDSLRQRVLDNVPAPLREFASCVIEELTYIEAAERLGVKRGLAKGRMTRARRSLQAAVWALNHLEIKI